MASLSDPNHHSPHSLDLAQEPGALNELTTPQRALGWLDLGFLKSGEVVSFASRQSRERFNLNGPVVGRIRECLPHILSEDREVIKHTHKWKFEIGFDNCVERIESDQVTFAQLRPSGNWIPLIHNRDSERTDAINLILNRVGPSKYILLMGAMGLPVEPSPTDKRVQNDPVALAKALAFWRDHALVAKWMYHNHLLIPDSEQNECPWV